MPRFQGTITALVTPLRGGGVDFEALERLVERQIAAGVEGLVPCGTTGESPTLSSEEHAAVIERVVALARRRTAVIAGTGSNCTAEALRMSRHAAEAGADGLLLVSPYYNKPTQAGLFRHFSAIARAVPLPIVLYNIPGRCGVELSVETIRRLHEEHGTIVAIKHATGRVDDAAELAQVCPIDILSGDDPLTLTLMVLGAVGVVSVLSNLAPRAVRRLTQAALAGDFVQARAEHRRLFPLARALLSLETNPIPIKTALALRGLCAEEFRLPLCPLAPENRRRLEELLAANPLE